MKMASEKELLVVQLAKEAHNLIQYVYAHRENCMYSGGRRGEKEGERERKTICGFYLTCDALGI